ncbi:unnamed protein product [Xanthomonas translucens pv. translucens DSM 18974]|uniref:DUF2235 domain-containing protein n=2 Tax=Xanthomonas campestris pv. translucens TaxID=343 RepID=A0A1C3TRI6_XANCT|nr:unnamed protein product [Xanthomonas translucens pv. translucens DSM 18974]
MTLVPDTNGHLIETYTRYHQAPGLTPISVGLYDPVPTGYMELFDRRLPPSVVSGFQISAEHERRGLFPVDQIMPHGLSDDGRFLNVTVAGAHSDIGGSYLRGGLGVRSFNLMTDYHNGVFGAPLLPPLHAPTDPRMNVIHRSEEGNALFAAAPKIDRASAQGQVHQLTADAARYTPPGQIVHAAAQAPEPVATGLHAVLATSRPVQPSAGLADPALTEGDTLAARLLRSGQVDFKPYAPPMLDRPGVRVAGALGVVGAAASLYEATQTSDKIEGLLRQGNPLAAHSELTHYAGRNLGGWAGGSAAAYALGSAGAGPMVLIAADAYVMSKAGEKLADVLDNRAIYHQTDRDGMHWSFDGRAWSREGRADTTNDGVNNPTPTPIVASYDKARELNYLATNAAAALALKDAPQPDDPYSLPANDRDRPSLSPANWMRDAADGQWHRQVKTAVSGENNRGLYAQETASPPRAAELDAQAAEVVARNLANSPGAIAARYELAYHRSGWAADGWPMSPAVQQALPDPDALNASDGKRYYRDAEGHWASDGALAAGNRALELDTTRALLQPALAEHAQTLAAIPQSKRSPEQQQREETLYRYRIVGTELNHDWREAIELATQRTREAQGLSGDGALQLQRGPGGVYGADSPIEHLQRGADGVDRIAAITSTEDIQQALHEVRARQRAAPSAPALPTLASTASGSTAASDSNGATSGASPQLVLDVQAQTQAAIAAQQRQEREQQERQAQEQQQAQVREHAQLAQLEQARQADALRALQVQAAEEHQRSLMQRKWCLCYIPPETSLPTWTAMKC